jgi:hypothetical protein
VQNVENPELVVNRQHRKQRSKQVFRVWQSARIITRINYWRAAGTS